MLCQGAVLRRGKQAISKKLAAKLVKYAWLKGKRSKQAFKSIGRWPAMAVGAMTPR